MESFDVLDKERKNLGYTKIRGSVLEEHEYNMGCEVYIINDGKLLITQRCELKSYPLEWEVTGGCAKSGQSSLDTILAETSEEIGIEFKENELEFLDTVIHNKMFLDIYISNKKINLEDLILQKEEVKDAKYVTIDEFEKMAKENKIVKSVYERYKKLNIEKYLV